MTLNCLSASFRLEELKTRGISGNGNRKFLLYLREKKIGGEVIVELFFVLMRVW